ncbi:MAG: type III-A CRISPR-associated protein Cas10/Csm1 [Calditrichia bacterium]
MWNKERKARLLGALLHDIGKFQYRAEKTTVPHQENSANFIREYLGNHACVKDCLEEAIRLARSHHDASGDTAIQRADHVAAGEREEEEAKQARRPLLSVFTHIQNIRPGVTGEVEPRYFLPGAIDYQDVFPKPLDDETLNDENALMGKHRSAWEGFLKDVKAIPKDLSFPALVNTLLSVLEKWTARVSSAGYKSLPDISLYDHLRSVAAYADCYAEADDKEKPFLVIEADISGIQNFIYRIANLADRKEKGTAKTLRGRSFLIGLYADAVAAYLLDQLGLLNVHLLLNGGGGFTVLAPNQAQIREKLPQLRKQINDWLIDEFQGEIALNLAWKAFSEEDIRVFGKVKQQMQVLIGEEKYHRHFDRISDENFWRPRAFDENSITRLCNRCGNYISKEEGSFCQSCKLHKEIGQILPHTKTLVLIHSGAVNFEPSSNFRPIPFEPLNQTWVLIREGAGRQTVHDILGTVLKDVPSDVAVDVIRLNETDFLEDRFTQLSGSHGAGVGFQFRFLGNHAPKDENGDVMSFEELAEQSDGYPMLGVLRMDVDSLGAIFAHGFDEQHQTLSRIANLSRLFVLFFSGYINKLAEDKDHPVYINYSGGDDLFVVGGWTQVLEFARAVRRDFRRFVSENPHLTISGGMVIVWPSYPIRFAAEQAGDEEEHAKALDAGTPGEKDAFSVWECAYHWEEFDQLIQWGNTYSQLIQAEKEKQQKIALKSLLRYARDLWLYAFDTSVQKTDWIPRIHYKIHYVLKRRAGLGEKEISEKNTEIAKALAPLIQQPSFLRNIRLPADYVLLKTRNEAS